MAFAGFTGSALPRLKDEFTRADGALGANWTVGDFNVLDILSNQVRQSTAAAENGMYWNGEGSNDIACAFTLATFGSSDYAHYVHIDIPGSSYQYQLYLLTSGTEAELYGGGGFISGPASLSQTFATGDRIGCRITLENQDDHRLRLYRQAGASGSWTEVYNHLVVGAPPPPFYMGIGIYDSAAARVDDFMVESVISGGNTSEYGQAKSGQQNDADLQMVTKGKRGSQDDSTVYRNRSFLGWDVTTDVDGNPISYAERGPYV